MGPAGLQDRKRGGEYRISTIKEPPAGIPAGGFWLIPGFITRGRQARSGLCDVRSLRPLGPSGGVELDLVALCEALEALGLDGAEVNEHIRPTILLADESEPLCVIEPLHCTCLQNSPPKKCSCSTQATRPKSTRTCILPEPIEQ